MFGVTKSSPLGMVIPANEGFVAVYLPVWIVLTVLAVILATHQRRQLEITYSGYLQFLGIRWKLVTFMVSGTFVSLAGYFTDDETWDLISGFGMAAMTFLLAPWSVGILVRRVFWSGPTRPTLAHVYLALVASLFSFSWFYDGYLLLREGAYTVRYVGNLILSSVIYISAGIFWNLETDKNGHPSLAFLRKDWPTPPFRREFGKLWWLAAPLGAIAFYMLVFAVGWDFSSFKILR